MKKGHLDNKIIEITKTKSNQVFFLDNYKINLSYKKDLHIDGNKVSGSFFQHLNEIEIVIEKELDEISRVETLLHELCHFKQAVLNTASYQIHKDLRASNKLYNWINYKEEFSEDEVLEITKAVFNFEKECEFFVYEFLGENNYIKRSNAYLVYIALIGKNRTFFNNRNIYDEKIYNLIPSGMITFESVFNNDNLLNELFIQLI